MDDSNDPHPSASDRHVDGAGLPGSTLANDDMFEALAHQRRRYLLYSMLDGDGCSLRELAGRVADWESSSDGDDADEDDVERVYASLYHAHVPKLADLGIVEFDRRDETIAAGPNAKPVLDVLEHTGASGAEALERHARENVHD